MTPPSNTSPANTGTVDVDITMNGTKFTATLDRKAAPCTVNSFLSLASQGFYDNTDCHRLTKSAELNILQCGDPSGKGNGGPGYTFENENAATTKYPVGTLAMANSGTDSTSGAGTNGSQFFIVYGKTVPSGSYTVFGTVSAAGMKVGRRDRRQGRGEERAERKAGRRGEDHHDHRAGQCTRGHRRLRDQQRRSHRRRAHRRCAHRFRGDRRADRVRGIDSDHRCRVVDRLILSRPRSAGDLRSRKSDGQALVTR